MIELWHGGKRWEGSPEIRPAKQGNYECGPGLYLTTSYERAQKYAKGGKVTTRVTLADEVRWLEKAKLPLRELLEYARTAPRVPKRDKLLADLVRCPGEPKALDVESLSDVSRLVNLLVNSEALAGKLGVHLAAWLTSKGIDASLYSPTNGEQWVIVFNPAIIRKHRVVSATDVKLDQYHLPKIELSANPKGQPMARQQAVASVDIDIPGQPGLALRVYGMAKATSPEASREQGFFVSLNGVNTPRSELSAEHRAAVRQYLETNYPEHALI